MLEPGMTYGVGPPSDGIVLVTSLYYEVRTSYKDVTSAVRGPIKVSHWVCLPLI